MTRYIPQSFIDELLARVDIVSVIEPFLSLKKAGSNYVALCPFHQEKTPSFSVSQSKQFYHCFGCGVGGNAISFLMEYERMGFIDAIEALAAQAGMEIPREAINAAPKSDSQELYSIMGKTTAFYQAQLFKHPQAKTAIEYLKKRGLTKEIVQQFKIGFAPPGWDSLLQAIGQDTKQRQLLTKAGMLIQNVEDSSYDRFRNRIMFPITDRRGRIIAFGGRVLNDDDTPKYLNSPETPIFHKGSELYGLYEARQANRNLKCLLLVEGYMDVIALAQHGINYAVATLGTATSANHIQNLFRVCQEVIFCFDGDNAGRQAAWRALEVAFPVMRDEWQVKFMFLPEEDDPDSLVRKEGKENFEKRIQKANTLSEFFFANLSSKVDMQQIDGRARLVSLTMPYLKKMSANVMHEMLTETLAKRVKMNIETLQKYVPPTEQELTSPSNLPESQHAKIPDFIVRTIIILLIQNPILIKEITDELPQADMPGINLLRELIQLLRDNPSLSTGAILEYWRDKPEFKHLTKLAGQKHLLSERDLTSEFSDSLKKLHSQILEHDIDKLMNKAAAEGLNDDEKKQLQNLLLDKQKHKQKTSKNFN